MRTPSKITKTNFQGIVFATSSCQKVGISSPRFALRIAGPTKCLFEGTIHGFRGKKGPESSPELRQAFIGMAWNFFAVYQEKQLKGKIVSHFFTLFHSSVAAVAGNSPRPPMRNHPSTGNGSLVPHGEDRPKWRQVAPFVPLPSLFLSFSLSLSSRFVPTGPQNQERKSSPKRKLALIVQRIEQDLQHQVQATARIKASLFDDVQERVKGLEKRLRHVMDHEVHVNQTIDRNTHSQSALISAIIAEQSDIRKLVEDLASRLDRSQEENSATQSDLSTNALLEINDLSD